MQSLFSNPVFVLQLKVVFLFCFEPQLEVLGGSPRVELWESSKWCPREPSKPALMWPCFEKIMGALKRKLGREGRVKNF